MIIKSEANPEGIITLSLWKKWIRTGANLVQRGGNGRVSLIAFDSIPAKYKELIEQKFGNPRQKAVTNSFLDDVVLDTKAKEYFASYRLSTGDHLPIDFQRQYTANASVLNAIKNMYARQLKARASLSASMRKFWDTALTAVNGIREEYGHKLPTSKSQLKRVYDAYLKDGYDSLVSRKFGNNNTEKITPEIENWIVAEMAQGRQSVEMLYMRYKLVAEQNGWRTDIEAASFRHRITQPHIRQMIDLKRYGARQFQQIHGHTFKLKRATYANDIWVSDGTAVNWYYREGNKVAMATTYMVMDSRSRKYLGWALKKGINKEDFEMQLHAYRMAIRTAGAKPHQLLYDNQGGHKKAESRQFYSDLAKIHFPTRAYRPSGKPIEQAFGDFQRLKLSEFPFWSGFSRESHSDPRFKPNYRDIEANIDQLPSFEELVELFDKVVAEWNDLDFNGKGSPNKIYNESRNPDEKPIALEELSELFWNMSSERKYHQQGITMRINGEEQLFEVYTDNGDVDFEFRKRYLHQKFYVKYDPEWEYKEVELYQIHPTGGYQKIATASPKREVSRSVKYLDEGERAWIDAQMKGNDDLIESLDKEIEERGYDEKVKWTSWRAKIEKVPVTMSNDNDEEDPDEWVLNNM